MTIQSGTGAPYDGGYGGFSATDAPPPRARASMAPPAARMDTPTAHHRPAPSRRKLGVVLTGVLAALGLGLGLGYLSRADLQPAPEPPPPPDVSALTDTPAVPAPAAVAAVTPEEIARIALGGGEPAQAVRPTVAPATPARIAVAPPTATAPSTRVAPPPAGPATVRRVAQAPVAAPPVVVRRVPLVVQPAPTPAPVFRAAAPPPAAAAAVVAADTNFRPAFHCDWRLRPSERMVCGDAQLSAYDRELNRAFRLAVEAGAPRAWLREEQDEWVMVDRERAARFGPDAVAEAYRRRIADLRALYD